METQIIDGQVVQTVTTAIDLERFVADKRQEIANWELQRDTAQERINNLVEQLAQLIK